MSPQEFWLLANEASAGRDGAGGSDTEKIGNMDRATFDGLVRELHA